MRRIMERASRSLVSRVRHDLMICGSDARAPRVIPRPAKKSSIGGLGGPI